MFSPELASFYDSLNFPNRCAVISPIRRSRAGRRPGLGEAQHVASVGTRWTDWRGTSHEVQMVATEATEQHSKARRASKRGEAVV